MNKVRITLVSLFIALVGCSAITGAYVKKESFTKGMTFAIVSVSSHPTIKADGTSIIDATDFDVVTSIASKDRGLTKSAKDIFAEGHNKLIKALSGSNIFTVKNESSVLKSSVYKKAKFDDPKGLLIANGYNFIKTKESAAALAKELGVDAVITVSFRFSMVQGSSIGIGPAAVTKRLGGTYIKLVAYNQQGEVIWRDFVSGVSKKGYTEPGTTSFSLKKLYPFLQESTDMSVTNLVTRVQAKVQ